MYVREKRRGIRRIYVHADESYERSLNFWRRGDLTNHQPAKFRAPRDERRKPVKGGRWFVRKLSVPRLDGRSWHAYNQSRPGGGRSFYTHQAAVMYSVAMAKLAQIESPAEKRARRSA